MSYGESWGKSAASIGNSGLAERLQCEMESGYHVRYCPTSHLEADGDFLAIGESDGYRIHVEIDDSQDDVGITLDALKPEPLRQQLADELRRVSRAYAAMAGYVEDGNLEPIHEWEWKEIAGVSDILLDGEMDAADGSERGELPEDPE